MFLANYTTLRMRAVRLDIGMILLSVCLSLMLYIVAKWYLLQQKCQMNTECPLEIQLSTPYTVNKWADKLSTSGSAVVNMLHVYSRCRTIDFLSETAGLLVML